MIDSPELFRKWTAIGTVAGALERRCWTTIRGEPIYPNLYMLLVAKPGVGKTNAISKVKELAQALPSKALKLAPDGVTREKLFEELEDRSNKFTTKGTDISNSASITAFVDEFGVFCKRADLDFMAALAKLYDCPSVFEYKTKHHGENHIENVAFSLLAGCTPSWIKHGFPPDAFETGFPARLIMLHSTKSTPKDDLFSFVPGSKDLKANLVTDLKAVIKMQGEFTYTTEAQDFLRSWYNSGMQPIQEDPRLVHYNTRRILHITKLTMCVAAARHGQMEIGKSDVETARGWLLEAESTMPLALAAAGGNPYKEHMDAILVYVKQQSDGGKRFVKEWALRQLLVQEVEPGRVSQMLDELVAARLIKQSGEEPHRQFKIREASNTLTTPTATQGASEDD